MNTGTLPMTFRRRDAKTITIEFDADQFERLAAQFGFFGEEFLDDLNASEAEYRQKKGKVRQIKSFKELRK